MVKRLIMFIVTVAMACFVGVSESSATLYDWNQSTAWAMSEEAGDKTYISNVIQSSGVLEVSEYRYDPITTVYNVVVTNLLFTLTDAVGDVYRWDLGNVSETFTNDWPPETGKITLDIHLGENNNVGFWGAGYAAHDLSCYAGNPSFPFYTSWDNGNIDLTGVWVERPVSVPEPSALFLFATGLAWLGVVRRFNLKI